VDALKADTLPENIFHLTTKSSDFTDKIRQRLRKERGRISGFRSCIYL